MSSDDFSLLQVGPYLYRKIWFERTPEGRMVLRFGKPYFDIRAGLANWEEKMEQRGYSFPSREKE